MACTSIAWPSHRPALRYCPDSAVGIDGTLNWIRKRADAHELWAIGKLTRAQLASLLKALASGTGACDAACLWPTLRCALKQSRSQQQQDLILLPKLLALPPRGGGSGTFLEIGAFNGVELSNTHLLEKCFGWRGLLIEANPRNFAALNTSTRVATKVHSAVCPGGGDGAGGSAGGGAGATVEMTIGGSIKPEWMVTSKVVGGRTAHGDTATHGSERGSRVQTVRVPCAPLRRLMHEHGYKHMDFLSLDVEGGELDVLQTVSPSAFGLVMVEEELQVSTRATIVGVRELLSKSGFVQPRGLRVQYNTVWESSAPR